MRNCGVKRPRRSAWLFFRGVVPARRSRGASGDRMRLLQLAPFVRHLRLSWLLRLAIAGVDIVQAGKLRMCARPHRPVTRGITTWTINLGFSGNIPAFRGRFNPQASQVRELDWRLFNPERQERLWGDFSGLGRECDWG